MKKLSRRRFLQTTAAASATASLAPPIVFAQPPEESHIPWPENGTLIPDEGWRLWLDTKAEWAGDNIFLPEDIAWIGDKLCAKGNPLPLNPPTGGWATLTATTGKEVILPTTVEQHFWGQHGAGADGKPRPYTPEEYRYAATNPPAPPADDAVPQNGAYFGVSWWHRPLDIPAEMTGKRLFLHIRGARLRAEVYLNQQLCGYSIMEELPFEADLTRAAKPGGENHLAIRLTNPFGRFDWVDGLNAKWGKVSLYRSHGFGGLDRGMTLSAHDGPRIQDVWVLNTPEPRKIEVNALVERTQHLSQDDGATLLLEVFEMQGARPLVTKTLPLDGGVTPSRKVPDECVKGQLCEAITNTLTITENILLPTADLWAVGNPKLYKLRITWKTRFGHTDTRTIAFGFRTFAPTGVSAIGSDTDAMFRLNGRRIRLYTSISWGFWGLNGLFPVPELAEKEVRTAQSLGLNCLNFHRNLAKEEVLRWQDRLGLLRHLEPGAGKLAIGKLPTNVQANSAGIVMEKPTSEADKFAQRFMFVKCVEMVKAYRSHPSVIIYCLQNELGADLNNPATLAVLKAMHQEDPSRIVELNDGFEQRGAAQAWYEPWDENLHEGKLHRSDQTKYGDWWNDHQGAGDQWYDEFYQSPAKFTYKAPYRAILTEYGEMEGCARPDNHALMIHQISETYSRYSGGQPASYDLLDHQEILAAYDQFLTRWGFRKAFPTAEQLFIALGRTCYDSWQNYMENARLSDELDYAAISGWESTAIENHSGIVDNLRNPKADPKIIAGSLLPVRPIAKQRALVIEQGQPATFDLWLANDTGQPATGTLTFSMVTPSGKLQTLTTLPAPTQTPDQFSYLLQEGFLTPPLTERGLHRFKFSLSSALSATQTKELWVAGCPECHIVCRTGQGAIGTAGIQPSLREQLVAAQGCHNVAAFQGGKPFRILVTSGLTATAAADKDAGETTGTEALPPPAAKPGHKAEPGEGATIAQEERIDEAVLNAVREGTPLLVVAQSDSLADGIAKQLAAAGAFTYGGQVGDFRAPWMGNWYFVREHPLYADMPQNQAMGLFYQAKGRQSNGLLVDGPHVNIMVGYSRDHDRRIGAGTFTCRLGKGPIVFQRCPDFQPMLQQQFLANAIRWLTSPAGAAS